MDKAVGRLWIISEFYYPVVTSTGYYMTEIAEHLASRRQNVHVITTSSIYNEVKQYERVKKEIRNNVCIHRIATRNIDKNNLYKRIIRLSWYSILIFFKALSCIKKGDELFVVTNPAFIILAAPLIKRVHKLRYTILVHDVFPENVAAIGKVSKKSPLYLFLKKVFDRAYAKADQCVSVGRDMSEVLASKMGSDKNITMIPNWSDVRDVYPTDKSETKLIQRLNLEDRFIFQFAGNLGQAQGLDNILEAIKIVDNDRLHFLFIGGGAKNETIREFIRTNPQKNVTLIGFQDRADQNDFLNACDVGIITLGTNMYGLGVPSKSYNIMASGKPIIFIGDSRSEIALCVKEYRLGWTLGPDDPIALARVFNGVYAQRDMLSAIKIGSRHTAETVFAKDLILRKYDDVFNLRAN